MAADRATPQHVLFELKPIPAAGALWSATRVRTVTLRSASLKRSPISVRTVAASRIGRISAQLALRRAVVASLGRAQAFLYPGVASLVPCLATSLPIVVRDIDGGLQMLSSLCPSFADKANMGLIDSPIIELCCYLNVKAPRFRRLWLWRMAIRHALRR
jgi:hypothetical protein